MKRKPICALLGTLLLHTAWATIPLYKNTDVWEYAIPGNPPPQIDARAFDNENSFTIDFETFHPGTPFYQTLNTLFYTNSGTMIANSPITNALSVALLGLGFQNFGCGYKFDYYDGVQDRWADTFCNPGTIRSVSTIDGNGLLFIETIFGTSQPRISQLSSLGEVYISATNIINPGTVEVSVSGAIKFNGRNVDLTGGQLIVEPPLNAFGSSSVTMSGVGAVGVNTNILWDPGLFLTPTVAESSYVPIPPFYVYLTNCQSYLDVKQVNPTYNIYRYVFLENDSPDVQCNVYIDNPNVSQFGFYPGAAHVEWIANVTDPASGNTYGSYLYLTDDYTMGAQTNDYIIGGVPLNFSFLTSSTELLFGPQPINFSPLPDAYITNNYAAFVGALTPSTASTNVSSANPHGTITNLPGQVYICASNELNLAFTTITAPNYVNLNCTNQFDGSPGAYVAAPYSDIALGVTNGFLTVSNVLVANLPNWSGPIQAFSSDWFAYDTVAGVTNEYKVLIVYSKLEGTGVPWTQNLYLHGTNTLVISDHLNVYGSLYSDARTLVLNTNELGAGATSLDGELMWLNSLPLNANSGSGVQQFPNLLWVTNGGAIRVSHNANFGNLATPAAFTSPGIPAVAASAKLSVTGTNAVKGDKVTIGTNQYVFVTALTNTIPNQVKWSTTSNISMSNLIAAINHGAGSGTTYSTSTHANPLVTAGPLSSHAFTVTATTAGTGGNLIAALFTPATAKVNLTWSSSPTLANGADPVVGFTNYTSFNNHGLIADQGTAIWTSYFENDGMITNGAGSFNLQSSVGILTNGSIYAGSDVILVATNTPGMGVHALIISNTVIQAGHKLTLWTTNLTDTGVTNGNIWAVGATSGGGTADSGFNIPVKPPLGDLLGTTVTNIAPFNKTIYNVWAGKDYGLSAQGFSNNLAVGHLVFDSFTTNNGSAKVAYNFSGAGTSNALYVDLLELRDGSTTLYSGNATNHYNLAWLQINTNMVIYYAQAVENGHSVAQALDNETAHGGNDGRLRWVYSYAGYLSSTNFIYTNLDGTTVTNTVNTALAQSSTIDSDGDGIPNNLDPTPFFVPSEANFTMTMTNLPPLSVRLQWTTIPNATNYIYYTTNISGNNWLAFTNFKNWYFGNNVARTNANHSNWFASPQTYINNASLPDNSQQTNVWVFDAITNVPHYYKIMVQPWLNFGE